MNKVFASATLSSKNLQDKTKRARGNLQHGVYGVIAKNYCRRLKAEVRCCN